MWNRKRIAYTAVSAIVTALLVLANVEILSREGVDVPTQITCGASLIIAFAAMIVGLGEAAAREEKRRQQEQRERAAIVQAVAPAACDLCADPRLFVRCVGHQLSLCWGCYMHHDPYEKCDVRAIPNARERAEARV